PVCDSSDAGLAWCGDSLTGAGRQLDRRLEYAGRRGRATIPTRCSRCSHRQLHLAVFLPCCHLPQHDSADSVQMVFPRRSAGASHVPFPWRLLGWPGCHLAFAGLPISCWLTGLRCTCPDCLYRAATGAGSTVACSHAAVMQPAGLHNSSRAVIRLEYVEKHAKETGEQNALAAAVRCATRCCLSWLHCCLQFVTEYAYMYVAIIGEPFCPSTCKSFQLFTKYPAQVALNTLTSVVLGFLVCIGVPFALVLAAFFELRDSWVNFQPVAVCVIILAYIISRMSVGVYDAILTTLFICAMRDEEYCGGQHMGPELRQAPSAEKGDGGVLMIIRFNSAAQPFVNAGSRSDYALMLPSVLVKCTERVAKDGEAVRRSARTLLGHELVALEKYDKAIQQYRSAIDVDPRHYGAWWGLGRVCQCQEDLVQAKYNFLRAVEINGSNQVLRTSLGMVLQALGEPQRALQLVNRAAESSHCRALALFQKACILSSQKQHLKAADELVQAKRLAPREPCIHVQMGRVQLGLGNVREALQHFTHAMDLCAASGDRQLIAAAEEELRNAMPDEARSARSLTSALSDAGE
ncbi:Cdc27, partial [Symbiodinium necroappetens]